MEVVRVHKIRLETNRLVLRELEEKDAKFLVKGLAPIEVTKYLVLVPHPYALTDAEWFINKTMSEQNAESRTGYPLAITLKSEVCVAQNTPLDAPIGVVDLKDVNHFNGTTEIGYWLNKDFWRKGIMTEALNRAIEFAFTDLNLRRINIFAATENIASNATIKKAGFVFEGMAKSAMRSRASNLFFDKNMYGLLKEDYKELRVKN